MAHKSRYIVALPLIDIRVNGYDAIEKIGTTFATTEGAAVGNYLHRVFPEKARVVQSILRDLSKDYKPYALRLENEYHDDSGQKLVGLEETIAEEIEICLFLAEFYKKRRPQEYLEKSRRLLSEFDLFKDQNK